MKAKLLLSFLLSFSFYLLSSQIPRGFNYQAIARDGSNGDPLTDKTMQVKIGILSDTILNTMVWEELFNPVRTNGYGMFTIVVGTGVKQSGSAPSFSAIDWTKTPLFLRTTIYYQSSWKVMGTTKLQSVPYSMVAANLEGTVPLLSVKGSTTTMDSALFVVRNNTGQIVFAVYNEGVRIYVDDGKAKGATKGGFAIGSFDRSKGTPSQPLFVVDPDSIRGYIDDNGTKATKGGFAIGSFNASKTLNQRFFTINSDSIRMYINDLPSKAVKGGFAIGGFDKSKGGNTNFLNVATDVNGIINPSQNRILWYPTKNAFLTGKVLIESNDSVGENSFASGFESKSVGKYSQALGYQSVARGDYSSAFGYQNVANGYWSTAIGASCLVGEFGSGSMAVGWNCYAGGGTSIAAGAMSFANGESSFALGASAGATGDWSTALGAQTLASGRGSTALGESTQASGAGSTATGLGTIASGKGSFSAGWYTTASSYASAVFGQYNITSGNSTSWVATDPLFILGNGVSSSSSHNAITVLKNGNIGIGIATPANPIELGGTDSKIYMNSANSNMIMFNTNGVSLPSMTTRSVGTKIVLNPGVSASQVDFAIGISNNSNWYSVPVASSAFAHRFFAGTTEILTILGNGNVGIGTITPANKLDVNGCIRSTAYDTPTSGTGIEIGYIASQNAGFIQCLDRGTITYKDLRVGGNTLPQGDNLFTLGSSATRWKSVWSANGTIQTSDVRLKTNITEITYGIESIMNLRPVSFNWKEDLNGQKYLGLVAQEVSGIINEVVYTGTDPNKMLGINYSQLVPVLIKGIQEQQKQIESTKQENLQLKSRLQTLQEKVDQIEALLAKAGVK